MITKYEKLSSKRKQEQPEVHKVSPVDGCGWESMVEKIFVKYMVLSEGSTVSANGGISSLEAKFSAGHGISISIQFRRIFVNWTKNAIELFKTESRNIEKLK